MNKPIVIFDLDPDGWTSAWAAYNKFDEDGAEYIGIEHGNELENLENFRDKDVYIFDLEFPRHVIEHINIVSKSLIFRDHHKSSFERLSDLPGVKVDTTKSACRLAWEYFFPDTNVPGIVAYVEDRDLWKHQLTCTAEINSVIMSHDFTFSKWDYIDGMIELFISDFDPESTIIKEGEAILRYKNVLIKQVLQNKTEVDIDGHVVPAVNCPIFRSELGHELAQNAEFSAIWYETKNDRKVSLRVNNNGNFDVSELAKSKGGGGHKKAAGYGVKLMKPNK